MLIHHVGTQSNEVPNIDEVDLGVHMIGALNDAYHHASLSSLPSTHSSYEESNGASYTTKSRTKT
jgi:hypothetical protein